MCRRNFFLSLLFAAFPLLANCSDAVISVNWNAPIAKSKTSLSIQVCPEPPMRRESRNHDQLYADLRDMKVDLARLQPWFPYPKLSVAELEPPKDDRTSWDFKLIDPIVEDFFKAADGRPVMVNFGTIPEWMWKTEKLVPYPADPNEIDWNYSQGNELRDPSLREVVGYYHRLASWYIKGGFTDEFGKRHTSGHNYRIAYWEVLNEINLEHHISPELYVSLYDAIVTDLHQLDPEMKFSSLALAGLFDPGFFNYFEYFLNPANHKAGIPIDMISFHFYTDPAIDESLEIQQHTIFLQADAFYAAVDRIESIRKRLAPNVKTYITELGSFNPEPPNVSPKDFSDFWLLSGGMFAHIYPKLVREGIDYIAAAELIDYPTQVAATTLVDWNTGQPNARYWVTKLLHDSFGPGDYLVETSSKSQLITAQGFLTAGGQRKLLLVNERDYEVKVNIPGVAGARMDYVDKTTGSNPPEFRLLSDATIVLSPRQVAVVTLKP